MSKRRLSPEERELWARLKKSVRPLVHWPPPDPAPAQAASQAATAVTAAKANPSPAAPSAPPAAARAPGPPPLVPLQPRDRRRLSRGISDVEARFDLHGMSQDRAFLALTAFLRGAQARGHKTVLVITGKGRAGDTGRGILRIAVPEWLSRPDLRNVVLGVEEAARRHGGPGALYVRLRRRS